MANAMITEAGYATLAPMGDQVVVGHYYGFTPNFRTVDVVDKITGETKTKSWHRMHFTSGETFDISATWSAPREIGPAVIDTDISIRSYYGERADGKSKGICYELKQGLDGFEDEEAVL